MPTQALEYASVTAWHLGHEEVKPDPLLQPELGSEWLLATTAATITIRKLEDAGGPLPLISPSSSVLLLLLLLLSVSGVEG